MLDHPLEQPLMSQLDTKGVQEFSINSYQVPFSAQRVQAYRESHRIRASQKNKVFSLFTPILDLKTFGFSYVSLFYLIRLLSGWCVICLLTSTVLVLYSYSRHSSPSLADNPFKAFVI